MFAVFFLLILTSYVELGSEIILDIKNLNVSVRSNTRQKHILDDVSFHVKSGKILGITGESGSGKSMTAKTIMKLLDEKKHFAVAGNMYFEGKDLISCNEQELNKIRGKEISIVFQQPESIFNPIMTCGKQVAEAILIHQHLSKQVVKEKVFELFMSVGLTDTKRMYDSYPHQLSGGQLQRVAIAMAICNNPKIIIADEATSSLDQHLKKGIVDLLLNIRSSTNCAIIFITHDLRLLTDISDDILMLKDGKVIDFYPTNEQSPQISDYTSSYLKNSFEDHGYKTFDSPQNNLDLEFSNVNKIYYRYLFYPFLKQSNQALRNISFSLSNGMIMGVFGASGSGKSTLAKILVGLEDISSGKITVKGEELNGNKGIINKNRAQVVQMVFQDASSSLNPRHTIRFILQEVLGVFYDWSKEKKESAVLEILQKMVLGQDILNRFPEELSGGQKQRICLARVLLIKPSIIIFDESMSALDIINQKIMMDLILDLHKEYRFSAIFISHDPSLIKYLCSHVIQMEEGQIVRSGTVEKVLGIS